MIKTLEIKYLDEFICVMDDKKNAHHSVFAHRMRGKLTNKYAWAIPTCEALNAIVEFAPHGIVEIGAGTGYWAWLLKQMGLEVFPYDLYTDLHNNNWHEHALGARHFMTVYRGGPLCGVSHASMGRTLMLSWPPYNGPMAYESLKAFLDAGGTQMVFIGEGNGGCTGDKKFHKLMLDSMDSKHINLPQWPGIHDAMYLCTRKLCRRLSL